MRVFNKHLNPNIIVSICLTIILAFALVGCSSTTNTTTTNDTTDNQDLLNSIDGYTSDVNYEENNVSEIVVDESHRYKGTYVTIETLGIEEFDSIKTDAYEDIPKGDGNVFVVIYMELTRNSEKEIYFSPDYCEFDVDGQPATTTFLGNDPREGYRTIFGNLEFANNGLYYDKRGFMVIEAPKNWKNITFKYTGWRYDDLGNIIVKDSFTRNDIHAPIE